MGTSHSADQDIRVSHPGGQFYARDPGEPLWRPAGELALEPQASRRHLQTVMLNVYDLDGSTELATLNGLLRPFGTGVFHCGVQVFDKEWSFRGSYHREGSGIFHCSPAQCAGLKPRESVSLGMTTLFADEVVQVIKELEPQWSSRSYDMLRRNCSHFCEEFCRCLRVDPPPSWVMSLAGAGATLMEVGGLASMVAAGISSVLVGQEATQTFMSPPEHGEWHQPRHDSGSTTFYSVNPGSRSPVPQHTRQAQQVIPVQKPQSVWIPSY